MAAIKITPINSNGISPKNILTDLFEPLAGTSKTLIYPMDLANNPSFSHAIQFTVYDYKTELSNVLDNSEKYIKDGIAEFQTLSNAVARDATKAKKASSTAEFFQAVGGGDLRENISKLKPSEVADAVSKVFRAASYKTTKSKSQAYISLYMPDHLTTSYDSHYTSLSMTETFGAAGYLANAYADKNFMSKVLGDTANILNTPEGRFGAAAALGKVVGALGGNADNARNFAAQASGIVPNPQMQLLYQGIDLRSFQLDFIFTPISAQEAKMVENIINAFTYFSVPELANETGQYLIPPQIFNIKFSFTGNPGVLGAVQNVFTNTLSTMLGSGAAAALNGSGEKLIDAAVGGNDGSGNAKVFKVGDCILKSVGVDYAPNGWATYNDGYPVQTRLTLQFQEMDIVTKGRITEWTGFKGTNTVNNVFSYGNERNQG